MNVLICGGGKGSWIMRGQQLGAAIGARVTSSPTEDDMAWADLVVLVKKHAATLAPLAHRAKKPIVWDALDFWSQPAENRSNEGRALQLLGNQIRAIKPALVIGATEAMTRAAQTFCQSAYLPHHSWAGLVPTPPREHVAVVAYEGSPGYLGRWRGWLTEACTKRGWSFVVNPKHLSEADIVVAFRDLQWDGWICREWKSGVKVVNAIAAGRPMISQASAAFRELPTFFRTIETVENLNADLDHWSKVEHRQAVYEGALYDAPLLTLDAVAKRYTEILSTVGVSCTV